MQSSILSEFFRFGLVGVINTAAGFSVIVFLMTVLTWSPAVANAGGYAVGLLISFVLNRRFTFRAREVARGAFVKYVGVCLFCYGINLVVLLVLIARTATHPVLAQAFAMIAYSISFFILCRILIFPARRN